ncbi:cache domain-containing sensor histidine kinase [Paenibacillus sp. strain BS8-2]
MGRSIMNPLTKLNMKRQLILLFLVMVSPVFLLHWYGNIQAEKLLKDHVTSAYVELIKQNHALIGRDIDTIDKVTATIIQHPATQRIIPNGAEAVIERVRKYDAADKLLASLSIPVNGGEAVYYSLYIYDPQDHYFFAPKKQVIQTGVYFFNDKTKPAWFDEALEHKGSGYMDLIEVNKNLSRTQTLAFIRAVNNTGDGDRIIGVLVATNMEKKVQEAFDSVSLPEGHLMMFTDWSGRILTATQSGMSGSNAELPSEVSGKMDQQSSGTLEAMTEDYIYIINYSRVLNQRLIYQIPIDSLLKQQNELKRVIQFITVAYMMLGCVVLLYFWRSLMTPLQKLAQFVRTYEPGKLVPETPGKRRHDEIGVLMAAMYDMARRLNALIHYKYYMDIKQKESQLQLLYQQINPHLLYNTLESIYWKSTLEGNTESSEMIKELSKLMKIGLSRGRELIRLEEEMEHAGAYVNLQQKRYSYEFKVIWNVQESAKAIRIPKITLQPLIENAIIHGVKLMGDDGEITITASIEGERATIKVEDNGYKHADIAAIERLLYEEKADHTLGYGIRNIHQRIQLHFGNVFGLSYRRREEGGTAAVILLPATYEEDVSN